MRRMEARLLSALVCLILSAGAADAFGSGKPAEKGGGNGAGTAGVAVSGTVALDGKGAARDVVIYLEGSKKAEPLPKAVVDQREKTFVPHVSVVTVGTTVQFPNNDTIFHNVFAYFSAKKFDLGVYPRGATKQEKFDRPGLVSVLCNVHSDMSAYIMVVDTPYYAVSDKHGKFTLHGVPPGAYTLHAWHESGRALTQTLTLTGEKSDLALNLTRK